jgi:hypothetical protein
LGAPRLLRGSSCPRVPCRRGCEGCEGRWARQRPPGTQSVSVSQVPLHLMSPAPRCPQLPRLPTPVDQVRGRKVVTIGTIPQRSIVELYYASSPLSVLGTDFRILGDSHLRNCGGFLRWATLECAKPRLGPSRPLLNSNLSPKQPLPQRLSERPSSEREARSTAAGPAPSPRSRPRGPRSPRGPRGGRGSRGRGRGSDGGR